MAVPRGGQAEPIVRILHPDVIRPKGIVHFIGGAFVGAAPQLSYGALTRRIASEGYTVVKTPYPFTFNHESLATDLHRSFKAAVQILRDDGQEAIVPRGVPVHGVGHSNGALMHALIASTTKRPPVTSNVLISFNNKEVADAIPIPGFVERVQPVLQRLRKQGLSQDPTAVRAAISKTLTDRLPFFGVDNTAALGGLISQIASCLAEVEAGNGRFVPSPQESRAMITGAYNVPHSLLIRYQDDNIDETPELAQLLRRGRSQGRNSAYADNFVVGTGGSEGDVPDVHDVEAEKWRRVQELCLRGTHITPCGGFGVAEEEEAALDTPSAFMRGAVGLLTERDLVETSDALITWLNRF